jgi:two-component system NarL family response regulator
MGTPIRIVIADDHRLFREGLRLILHQEKGIKIVGEAVNGPQAISVVHDLKPDVVLLDISMPEMNGIEVLPVIKKESPKTKPLMLTASVDEAKIFKALKAGAKGYMSKDASVPDLIKAIQAVQRGELWVQRRLLSRFFDEEAEADPRGNRQHETTEEDLSPREQEVLRCLVSGCTNKEIAEQLFISEKTVKTHLNNIFRKLRVTRRLHAILYAINRGLA